MISRPRRRWFQFSIGTMLLAITVFALWLGWELSYIRERQEMRKWVEQQGGSATTVSEWRPDPFSPPASAPTATIPVWRRWLGDEAMHEVALGIGSSESDLARIRRIFPEAESSILSLSGGVNATLELLPDKLILGEDSKSEQPQNKP